MNEPSAVEPADLWQRAAARAIDALVMAILGSLMTLVAALVSVLIAQPDLFSDENWEDFFLLFLLLTIAASIPVARYEVASTARRGQTLGKRSMGIRVVHWDDHAASTSDHRLPLTRSLVRWAVPHIAGVTVAVTAAMVSFPMIARFRTIFFISAGAGLTAWMLVYLSSLWDKDGRGWHDKAAGTVVVEAASLSQRHDTLWGGGPGADDLYGAGESGS